MAPHNVKWFAIFGFGLLVVGVFAARFLIQGFRAGRIPRTCLFAELCVAVGGIALGSTLFGFTIHYSPTVKTVGFPFLAAAFELQGAHWVDYLAAFTLPAAIGNFVVGVLTPHLRRA
jgi:hypothetical protein